MQGKATKVQLAIAVLKGKREQLKQLQNDYVNRYIEYAKKFGKDPSDVPRTIYADMITDYIERLTKEIEELEGKRVKVE